MTRESTLDEFLASGGGDGRERSDPDDGETDEDGETSVESEGSDDGGTADPDVDPPAVTCEWTPDGAACADCGATVERRWTDGGARVCADCKEW